MHPLSRTFRAMLLQAVLGSSLTSLAFASDRFPLYWIGPYGQGFRGPAGDVDGDGMADMLLASFASIASPSAPQNLIVRRGLNGSVLHSWTPSPPSYWTFSPGVVVSPAGDLNLDGFGDVALMISSWTSPGIVEVRSGQDASVLAIIPSPAVSNTGGIGFGIAGAGDLDGDTWPELLVTGYYQPPGACLGQAVYVFEAPGFALQQFNPPFQCGQGFGSHLGALDDVDGDGLRDYYVGASQTNVGFIPDAGWIGIFSGAGGTLIASMNGNNYYERLGYSVAALGDVTGDGMPEIAAGRLVPFEVAVLSLPSFSAVYTVAPGGEVGVLGDADGDGFDDFLVRRGTPQGEAITAFSGPSGSPIGEVAQDFPGGVLYPWGGLGDVNGDGLGDLVVMPWANGPALPPLLAQSLWSPWTWPMITYQPTVHVARNLDLVNTPAVGGTAQFEVVAPKRSGKPFQIAFSQDFVFPGLPLGPFLFPVAMDSLFWASFSAGIGGTLDATGHGSLTLPIPNDPALHGAVVQASGVVYDAAGPLGIGCVLTQLPVWIQ